MAVKKNPKNPKKPIKKTKKADKVLNTTPDIQEKTAPNSDNPKQTYEILLSQITDKAARFVQEYLIDLNKQKAAERAGYSPRSCAQQVSVLLKNPKVIAAINEGKRLIAERSMVNQDEVIKELALIGFADMKDYIKIDDAGAVYALPLDKLPDNKSRVIRKVREKRTIKSTAEGDQVLESTYEFELHDKVRSLLGILDRVKPGADDPQKIEVTHKLVDMPPEPKSMEEWEALYKQRKGDTK